MIKAIKAISRTVVLLLLLCTLAHGQEVVQKSLKLEGKSISYIVIQPTSDVSGILLLFPGKGESPKGVVKKTLLPEKLAGKGYVTIVPNLKYALFADDLYRKQLSEILRVETENRTVPGVVIGGFSAGGAVALSYAEYLVAQGGGMTVKSVFVIDPPIDLQRLYASSRKLRRYNCTAVQAEGQYAIDYLDRALGGSPDDQYSNYLMFSPYLANEQDGGNARWLKQVPIRLYTEPDIDFVKERLCAEYELQDLNAGDLENLNKLLRRMGNDRCELIVTKERGYHSWNIAEPEELASWIVR